MGNCGACVFWKEKSVQMHPNMHIDDYEGYCNRFPRQQNVALAIYDYNEAETAHDSTSCLCIDSAASPVGWVNPVTCANDWCGEYKNK